jgi:hypothetical protein
MTLFCIKRSRLVQMVKTRWLPKQDDRPFKIRAKKSGFWMVKSSLDRFINKSHNKYFIYAKTVMASHSKSGPICPVIERSDIRMPRTGIRLNPKTDHGSVFGYWLYSKTGQILRFWNGPVIRCLVQAEIHKPSKSPLYIYNLFTRHLKTRQIWIVFASFWMCFDVQKSDHFRT